MSNGHAPVFQLKPPGGGPYAWALGAPRKGYKRPVHDLGPDIVWKKQTGPPGTSMADPLEVRNANASLMHMYSRRGKQGFTGRPTS